MTIVAGENASQQSIGEICWLRKGVWMRESEEGGA